MTSPDPRGDEAPDRPGKALLRSGMRGILAVALAVLVTGAAAAAIAFAVAVTF